MEFENPSNGYTEQVTTGLSWLWVLLWAPIYYAVKGIWTHAILSFVLVWLVGGSLSVFSFGLPVILIGIIYAFMNKGIVRRHYLKQGWREVAA